LHFEITNNLNTTINCDVLIISVFDGVSALSGATAEVDKAMSGLLTKIIANNNDIGRFGKATVLYTCTRIGAQRIIVLGLGDQKKFTLDRLRSVSAIGARAASKIFSANIATLLHGANMNSFDLTEVAQALAEGSILGSYQFKHYKTDQKPEIAIETICIWEDDIHNSKQILLGTQIGQTIAQSVNLARDLVNHPSNVMTPMKLARHAEQIAELIDLDIVILDKPKIEELNMHAFMAVAKGSDEPAKLIVLRYNGAPDDERLVAFVGKGITFDSGGISLKQSYGMQKMKNDMAGGAAVLAATQAIASLKVPINLLTIVPCAENMPSSHSYKPGDVISSLSGKTIEVISTDAEGRLILADALSYARQLGATQIIDVATLSGACTVALGNVTTGMFGNDKKWKNQVLKAATYTGEKMWEMPMFDDYYEQIESEVADIKNDGGWNADAITAALFLNKFVDKVPWVHLDIAGTASCNKEVGYNVKGSTGIIVRTLIQVARSMANADR
jgi:leucyl aminopeptidase